MLNTADLEKKWLRYKIKSYIPRATIVISFVILTILASIIFKSQSNDKNNKIAIKNISHSTPAKLASPKKNTPAKATLPREVKPQKKKIETVVKQSRQIKLQPSLSFMKDMQNSSLPYYQPQMYQKPISKNIRKKVHTKTITVKEPIIEKKVITPKKPKVVKTEKIIINKKETSDDINKVIKRFKVNNNPSLSLFIAKRYYEIGNYYESYNYALITNQINKEIESSWIIFAKSLVKLNKKDKAINILKEYIKSSGSRTARLLLEEIQSGKFK